jgi:hypothetical protein
VNDLKSMAPQQTSTVSEKDSGMERTNGKCRKCEDDTSFLRAAVEKVLEQARNLKACILQTDKAGPEEKLKEAEEEEALALRAMGELDRAQADSPCGCRFD